MVETPIVESPLPKTTPEATSTSGKKVRRKQPKLNYETDTQWVVRNWILVAQLLIHGLACMVFPGLLQMAESGGMISMFACFVCVGMIASQFVILGFVFAMFPAGLMMRLSLVVGAVAVSICLSLFGVIWGGRGLIEWLQVYLSWIPILLVGCSIPFVIARSFFGWRLQLLFENTPVNPPFTATSLFVGMALIGFSLTLLKTGAPELIVPALASALVCVGVGLALVIPLTLSMLGQHKIRMGLVAVFFNAAFPLTAALVIYWLRLPIPNHVLIGIAVSLSILLLSYGTFLIGIRVMGVRFLVD